jgi:hypothetical protein
MPCGCNKKKNKKKVTANAKKAVQRKRKLPLVTIRRKPVTRKK